METTVIVVVVVVVVVAVAVVAVVAVGVVVVVVMVVVVVAEIVVVVVVVEIVAVVIVVVVVEVVVVVGGRALGVCPDAIRTHARILHVSQCFQGFEDCESGQKNYRCFTTGLQDESCWSCEATRLANVFSPLCALFSAVRRSVHPGKTRCF